MTINAEFKGGWFEYRDGIYDPSDVVVVKPGEEVSTRVDSDVKLEIVCNSGDDGGILKLVGSKTMYNPTGERHYDIAVGSRQGRGLSTKGIVSLDAKDFSMVIERGCFVDLTSNDQPVARIRHLPG